MNHVTPDQVHTLATAAYGFWAALVALVGAIASIVTTVRSTRTMRTMTARLATVEKNHTELRAAIEQSKIVRLLDEKTPTITPVLDENGRVVLGPDDDPTAA